MTYVLSNYKSSSTSCIGQHLFKFDPRTITAHPSSWTKKTIGTNTNNCGHLGLTYGRDESYLYAFSIYNRKNTVSFLDIDGNPLW